ncbi:MAG: hypothetical protein FJX42_11265 [Alphaproteobacteria bacterium]|nr:hypothetical protein [Alphaproteobacteria bacterium]
METPAASPPLSAIFADGATRAPQPRDIAFANTARVPLKGAFSGVARFRWRAKNGPSYRTMNRKKWILALALLALALFMYASIIWKLS